MQKLDWPWLALLLLLVTSFAIALDIYVPQVPHIASVMQADHAKVQWTQSAFMISIGSGQLLFGPLADRLGRRRTVFISCGLFASGCFACAFATSIEQLIMFRIWQALGTCGCFTCAICIVRDRLCVQEMSRYYNLLNAGIALVPLLAPSLGLYLDRYLGWQAPFLLLACFALALGYLAFRGLPESLAPEKRLKLSITVFKRYLQILKHPLFFSYATAVGLSNAALFTYFSLSPYLLLQTLKLAPELFPFYFGAMSFFYFCLSLLAAVISPRLGPFRTVVLGLLVLLAGALFMLFWYLHYGLSVNGYLIPMCVIACGLGLILGAGTTGALSAFQHRAGTATAVLSAWQFTFAGIFAAGIMQIASDSPLPLALGLCVLTSLVLLVFISSLFCKHFSLKVHP